MRRLICVLNVPDDVAAIVNVHHRDFLIEQSKDRLRRDLRVAADHYAVDRAERQAPDQFAVLLDRKARSLFAHSSSLRQQVQYAHAAHLTLPKIFSRSRADCL